MITGKEFPNRLSKYSRLLNPFFKLMKERIDSTEKLEDLFDSRIAPDFSTCIQVINKDEFEYHCSFTTTVTTLASMGTAGYAEKFADGTRSGLGPQPLRE